MSWMDVLVFMILYTAFGVLGNHGAGSCQAFG